MDFYREKKLTLYDNVNSEQVISTLNVSPALYSSIDFGLNIIHPV